MPAGATIAGRTCATALPAREFQGMVWVYPGKNPDYDNIASLPELDQPGWTSDDFIRDFPVDYSLILENVSDPDHGLFAHQATYFDSYSASPDYPMRVEVMCFSSVSICSAARDAALAGLGSAGW